MSDVSPSRRALVLPWLAVGAVGTVDSIRGSQRSAQQRQRARMASLNEEQRAYFALGSPSSSLGPWGVVVARFSLPDRKQGQGAVLELFDAHCERRVGEHRTIANTTHMRSLDRATWDWF